MKEGDALDYCVDFGVETASVANNENTSQKLNALFYGDSKGCKFKEVAFTRLLLLLYGLLLAHETVLASGELPSCIFL